VGANAMILMYHRVTDELKSPLAVSPERFKRQLAYICEHYQVVPLREMVARLGVGDPLTAPLAALTFDDGYRDNLEVAAPILRQFGVPATLFFAPGPQELGRPFWWDLMEEIGLTDEQSLERLKELPYVEFQEMVTEAIAELRPKRVSELVKRLYMNWDEVREWVGMGMGIGAHTLTHPILSRLNQDQAHWEIFQSRAAIERQVGKAIDLFSYPNGRPEDFTAETTAILRDEGFRAACTTIKGWNDPATDPLQLRRIGALDQPMALFALRLSPTATAAQQRLRAVRGRA
jgi:peptidoglycan/xylan/chitin deacetylase (PgdA/CDA1 family)